MRAAGPPSQWLARMQDRRSGGLGYGSAKATSAREGTFSGLFRVLVPPPYTDADSGPSTQENKLGVEGASS